MCMCVRTYVCTFVCTTSLLFDFINSACPDSSALALMGDDSDDDIIFSDGDEGQDRCSGKDAAEGDSGSDIIFSDDDEGQDRCSGKDVVMQSVLCCGVTQAHHGSSIHRPFWPWWLKQHVAT